MKRHAILLAILLPLAAAARDAVISSPDGSLRVIVTDNDPNGWLTYTVAIHGDTVIMPSRLGFVADYGDFSKGLRIIDTTEGFTESRYKMRQAKQSDILYRARTLHVNLLNAKGLPLTVQFSISDRDVAFRYILPRPKGDNPKCAVVLSETTSFRLPQRTCTFLTPQSNAMIGWERTKPSYEEAYRADAPMTDRSLFGQGFTFPCLFKVPSAGASSLPAAAGKPSAGARASAGASASPFAAAVSQQSPPGAWLLISETGVGSQYCGSHLSDYDPQEGYTIAFPMPGENNGLGSTTPGIPLPGATPWRTITVGRSLAPIVETTVAYDLVEPLYEPKASYPCGRYTWSWLIWQDASINYADQVSFIDLAAAMGYEFCLVDNWWDQRIGRDAVARLAAYARSKGVGLMLWYNSNGFENDAPQTPRHCMNTAVARDKEMAWLQSIGVGGIKVDFFGGDKQETMRLYEDILQDANRYGIQCIFHGCTIPRGWERMYPNYVSSEAVLASENVYFSEDAASREPFDLCMHPFVRNAVGTMDWGGVILNRHMAKDNRSRHTRKTTNAFELASGITNQAAIQCVALQPNNLTEINDAERSFLRQLPTLWDETRLVDGYPGRYVVLARRHDDQWYIAGLNATASPLSLSLSLPMLQPGQDVILLTDTDKKGRPAPDATIQKAMQLDRKGTIKVTMQPAGGFVILQGAE
ncbi:MAG: glycoside hydrolase family 97 catalytic domain-containing protein [Bacteroidaceae bacterium]|nr:glycoside hydrolase family 97 catalytic domain-containing protein [Bacteroidaceae bacterium]